MRKAAFLVLSFLFLVGCETNRTIVNNIDERDANEIIVFLYAKGISAEKLMSSSTGGVGETGPSKWNIAVPEGEMTNAMSILNQNGLPRKQGTNLLELFAKSGLMSTEKEESIRYQAGLEQQIANTIRKIDGVVDADVQLSFPKQETGIGIQAQAAPQRVTAAVYVKHTGVIDDPNSHLTSKIKRLVSGSVNGLDINDVTVISDRSRFLDPVMAQTMDTGPNIAKDYVSIWSIMMSKHSVARFRFLFFSLIFSIIVLVAFVGWILWKFYPYLKENGGFKQLFKPLPLKTPVEKE
jgi:type III secretion protein J